MRPGAVDPPCHVVPHAPGHGVVRIARQLAEAVGARQVSVDDAMRAAPGVVHVHVTDRIFGNCAETAAAALVALARRHRTTVTLHDLPQPGDGPVFGRRAEAYAAVLDACAGWVVSSHHELDLALAHLRPARAGTVVPLPVLPLPLPATGTPVEPSGPPVVGVLGWIYPGKGHREVIAACAGLGVTVRALGAVAVGHDRLEEELRACAAEAGVTFETTGWVDDHDLPGVLHAVDVPVAAHRHVSASGSVNSWVAARRRPLVIAGAYADEMARLRPGTLTLVPDGRLAGAVAHALREPGSTRLDTDVATTPHLEDCAAAYLAFWRRR